MVWLRHLVRLATSSPSPSAMWPAFPPIAYRLPTSQGTPYCSISLKSPRIPLGVLPWRETQIIHRMHNAYMLYEYARTVGISRHMWLRYGRGFSEVGRRGEERFTHFKSSGRAFLGPKLDVEGYTLLWRRGICEYRKYIPWPPPSLPAD